MSDQEQPAVEDEQLTLVLRALVDHDGPTDLRTRVERLLNETPAAGWRPAWQWRYALAVLALGLVATAILTFERTGEDLRHASSPTTHAVQESDRPVSSPAGHSVAAHAPPAEAVPRYRQPRRLERPPAFASRDPAWQRQVRESLPPEWAPAALEPPPPIAAVDIVPAPIEFDAPVLTSLEAIPALP